MDTPSKHATDEAIEMLRRFFAYTEGDLLTRADLRGVEHKVDILVARIRHLEGTK